MCFLRYAPHSKGNKASALFFSEKMHANSNNTRYHYTTTMVDLVYVSSVDFIGK